MWDDTILINKYSCIQVKLRSDYNSVTLLKHSLCDNRYLGTADGGKAAEGRTGLVAARAQRRTSQVASRRGRLTNPKAPQSRSRWLNAVGPTKGVHKHVTNVTRLRHGTSHDVAASFSSLEHNRSSSSVRKDLRDLRMRVVSGSCKHSPSHWALLEAWLCIRKKARCKFKYPAKAFWPGLPT